MLSLAELGEISKGLPSALKQLERTVGGDLTKIKDPYIRERILAHRAGKSSAYANAAARGPKGTPGHAMVAQGAKETGQAARSRSRAIHEGMVQGGPRTVAAPKKKKGISPWLLGGAGAGLTGAGIAGGYAAGSRD